MELKSITFPGLDGEYQIPAPLDPSQFAPSGYGLGNGSTYAEDINAITGNGWYWTNSSTANIPTGFGFSAVLAIRRTASERAQWLIDLTSARKQMMRHTNDGGTTWVDEYIIPPMELGVEYRTTERADGKPVYVKRISYTPTEAIAATTTVQTINIPHGISGIKSLVRWSGRTSENGYTFPYLSTSGGLTTIVGFGNSALVLRTVNTNWGTNWTFYFDMYYTK